MNKPHKHAPLIKAWADGAEIEYLYEECDQWLKAGLPTWDINTTYRIKPPKNTIKYRVALMSDGRGFWTVTEGPLEERFDSDPYFVRYLADWAEVEV